jgi:hypothetical protein
MLTGKGFLDVNVHFELLKQVCVCLREREIESEGASLVVP